MTEIESMAEEYVSKMFDPFDSFDEKWAAAAGYRNGFKRSRDLIVQELLNIASQTDNMSLVATAEYLKKFGESEIKE